MLPPAGRARAGPVAHAVVPAAPVAPVAPALPAPVRPRRKSPAREVLTVAQQRVSPTDEAAFGTIEAEVGGRAVLARLLASAQFPPAESRVVGLIADPRNDHESLAKVCALGGVPLGKLIKMFQEAVLTRGRMISIARIAEKLPDVAAAVMEDAIPGEKVCTVCAGYAHVRKPTAENPDATEPCAACAARGVVFHRPDHGVQKTALQLGGLLKAGGNQSITTIVAQGQGGEAATSTGSFDTLVTALDQVIYGRGRARFVGPGSSDVVEGDVALAEEGDPNGLA